MVVKPTQQNRHVVLDIETVTTNPDNEKGALTALCGRIVCICLLVDDGQSISERTLISQDERWLLEELWEDLRPSDIFVGHNILEFDLPFIRQRSWILNAKPSR